MARLRPLQHQIPTSVALCALGIVTATASPARAANLAAWGFEEGTGTTTADASGNGHTGTLVNGPTWTTSGHTGKALCFDGVNDRVSVAVPGTLNLFLGMTLEAWVKPTSLNGWTTVVMKQRSGGLLYALYASDDTGAPPAAYVHPGTDIRARGTATLPLDAWTHLAATFGGGRLKLYVNGALVRNVAAPSNIHDSTAPFNIGGNTVWGEYFAGCLDDIRIHDVALTAAQVLTNMNTPVGGSACVPTVEVCDGADNDCDGLVDEDLGVVTCGVGLCQRTVDACVGGVPLVCVPGNSAPETCNGGDDDCDGEIDEAQPPTSCGVGACAVTQSSCIDGAPQTCVPGNPAPETCGNSLDDDCDGVVDNGCAPVCPAELDQASEVMSGGNQLVRQDGVAVAQSFTAGRSGTLDAIELNLQVLETPWPLTLTLSRLDGGALNGATLGTKTLVIDRTPGLGMYDNDWYRIPLDDLGIALEAGTTYRILAEADGLYDPDDDFYRYVIGWYQKYAPPAGPYSGGFGMWCPPTGCIHWADDAVDFAFRTFVAPSDCGEPPPSDPCANGGCRAVPPSAGDFGWQSEQVRLRTADGATCDAHVTVSVSDQAVCYAAADGGLRCAGRVYDHTFGTSFVDTGLSDVHQVLLSPTFNSATGNAMCVRHADGAIECMGATNDWGQFGTGATGASSSFVRWSSGAFTALGTGTWDQMCARRADGQILCSGYAFGPGPVAQGSGDTFWVTTFGSVAIDDASVWRASNGRAECTVGPSGLSCAGETYGTPGDVVDGGVSQSLDGGFDESVCWLDGGGQVHCAVSEDRHAPPVILDRFVGRGVLALAVNLYTSTICAVVDDGSLWCVGDNTQGKLGVGHDTSLDVETQVAPPGSVRIGCGAGN